MGLTYVDGGKDCTDNATNFDYDRVRLGSSVSRSSRSPWCEKVYGVPCHEALVYAPKVALQLLAIFWNPFRSNLLGMVWTTALPEQALRTIA